MLDKYFKILSSYNKTIQGILAKEQNNKIIFYLLLLLSFGMLFLLNINYPLYADDWGYHFMTGSELTKRITGIGDILESQYNHYFTHGGRVVVHMVAEYLLYLGGWKCDLLNSLAYIGFVLAVYKIANINQRVNASLFFIINILIWFYQPAFSQTILWITGSANYLWGGLVILWFMYIYAKSFLNPQKDNSILKAALIFVAGVVAGWTNENTAFGMLVILCLLVLYYKKEQGNIPLWMITGIVGALIGYVLMVAAPGNFIRYDESLVNNSTEQASKIKFYLTRMLPVIGDFYKFALSLVFIYFFVLITYLYFTPRTNKKVVYLSGAFFVGAIVADLVMVASPEFPPRAWFGIIVFLIVAICILYSNIKFSNSFLQSLQLLICVFSAIYFVLSFQRDYKDLYKVNEVFEKREQIIDKQKDKANFDFVTKETINPQTGFPMIDEIPSDSIHWINMFYLRYHNIKSFKVERE